MIRKLLFLLLLGPALVQAQPGDSLDIKPKLYLSLGSFFPSISTTIRVDSKTYGLGTLLALEENLKLDSRKTTVRSDAFWSITKRSGLSGTFFLLKRSSQLQLTDSVQIADSTYQIGQKVNVWLNTAYFGIGYRYSIFAHDQWRAGLQAGINILAVNGGIQAEGNVSREGQLVFPVPTPYIGLFASGYLSPRFHARYDFSYFGIQVAGLNGRVFDNKFMAEYYMFKNVGVGACFNLISYAIKEIPFSNDFEGTLRFAVNGFSLYVAARF